MKIATFNINNVRKRLPNLIAWLRSAEPDVVCLQELKAADAAFPEARFEKPATAPSGADSAPTTAWRSSKGADPVLTRDGLPGEPDDGQSRYIEAAVNGVLASIYVPNGNPQPGPKFDYKLAWFDRLISHAATLCPLDAPVVLAGDFKVVPPIATSIPPAHGRRTRCSSRKAEQPSSGCWTRAGQMRYGPFTRKRRCTVLGLPT
jgi:exodeoxyribonuclease-3